MLMNDGYVTWQQLLMLMTFIVALATYLRTKK